MSERGSNLQDHPNRVARLFLASITKLLYTKRRVFELTIKFDINILLHLLVYISAFFISLCCNHVFV